MAEFALLFAVVFALAAVMFCGGYREGKRSCALAHARPWDDSLLEDGLASAVGTLASRLSTDTSLPFLLCVVVVGILLKPENRPLLLHLLATNPLTEPRR